MTQGIDTTENCAPHVDALLAKDYTFVCRYSSHSAWKNITRAEALALSDAGIYIVNVWESAGDRASFFSHAQGLMDGASAYQFAKNIGQPFSAPIYFAVDFDASQSETESIIHAYFEGVRSAMQSH